jgi:FtsP/CotA-like multicopper oxidase with cupredoxin domain
MSKISRRQFLAAGTVAAGGLLVGDSQAAHAAEGLPAAAGPAAPRPMRDHRIECGWIEKTLDGTRARLRAYNGQIPGPVLEMRPGETVRVTLHNRLTPHSSAGWNGDHNVPHDLGSTNLHFHGLEIAPHLFEPLGTGDPLAPMVRVGPGESKEYVFRVPENHPSGLYWYHSHHHGSTAVQSVSGMAGGIVVRGPIDEVPEIRAAREEFLVVNDIGLFPSEDPSSSVWEYSPRQNSVWQTFGGNVTVWNPVTRKSEPSSLKCGFTTGDYPLRYMLVNGQPFYKEEHNPSNPQEPTGTQLGYPTIDMRPGEVVRFRMLNANSDNFMPMIVEGHEVHMIALDGVNFDAVRTVAAPSTPNPTPQFSLAPANRAEFLIRAGRPGTYLIRELEQDEQFLGSGGKVVAAIRVAGAPRPMRLPTTLPKPARHWPLIGEDEIVRRRQVVFSSQFPGKLNPAVGIDFLINGAQYDELEVPVVAELGTAEEWELQVLGDHAHGSEGHPFHIHINSFEVISVGGTTYPAGTIQDTLWVPADTTAVIRTRFREWTGKSVFHCHILPHEDTGMMQNFLVVTPRREHHG